MRAIWKFAVPIDDATHTLAIPRGARIVHVARQDGTAGVCFWAEVDVDAYAVRRHFTVVGTGHPYRKELAYVGTIQTGPLVFHLLEHTE